MSRSVLISLLSITILLNAGGAYARVVFSTEESGTHEQSFYIDSGDTSDDFIDLEFGAGIDAKLRYDVVNDFFELNRSLELVGSLNQHGNILTLDSDNIAAGANTSIIAEQGTDANGELRYNATSNQWEVSNDGGAFLALAPAAANDSIFFAYDAGVTALSNVAVSIPFDTEVREDSDYSHVANSSDVTVNTSGNYIVEYECTAEVTTDDRSVIEYWFEINPGGAGSFAEVAGTRAASYHRTTGDSRDTASINHYQSFTAGDIFRVQGQGDSVGNLQTRANGCRLRIQRVDTANGLIGPQGPQGIQGIAGTDGTDGVSGGGWGDDGVTTTTALNAQIDGDLNVTGDIGSECGPYGIFWMERGTVVSNASWAMGNGQTPFGSIMGCPGQVNKIAATCTGAIGTSLSAVLYKNNTATSCNVNISTTVGQATISACSETFTDTDVLGVYAGTEVGAWTECVGTFWVKYD